MLHGALAVDGQPAKQERGVTVDVRAGAVIARFVNLDEAVRGSRLRKGLLEEAISVWGGYGVLQSYAQLLSQIIQPLGVHAPKRTSETKHAFSTHASTVVDGA